MVDLPPSVRKAIKAQKKKDVEQDRVTRVVVRRGRVVGGRTSSGRVVTPAEAVATAEQRVEMEFKKSQTSSQPPIKEREFLIGMARTERGLVGVPARGVDARRAKASELTPAERQALLSKSLTKTKPLLSRDVERRTSGKGNITILSRDDIPVAEPTKAEFAREVRGEVVRQGKEIVTSLGRGGKKFAGRLLEASQESALILKGEKKKALSAFQSRFPKFVSDPGVQALGSAIAIGSFGSTKLGARLVGGVFTGAGAGTLVAGIVKRAPKLAATGILLLAPEAGRRAVGGAVKGVKALLGKPKIIGRTQGGKPIIEARFRDIPSVESVSGRRSTTSVLGKMFASKAAGVKGGKRRVTKAELRKRSFRRDTDPRFFVDPQKQQVGVRKGKGLTVRRNPSEIILERKPTRGKVQVGGREVNRPTIRETFLLGKEPSVRREIIFKERSVPKKIPSSQKPQLTTPRRSAKEFSKFLRGERSQIKGLLTISQQTKKTTPFIVEKRKPIPLPSSTIRGSPSSRVSTQKIIKPKIQKRQPLPKVPEIQGSEKPRAGFRPGILKRIRQKQEDLGATVFQAIGEVFGRKKRKFILIEPEVQKPTTLPSVLKSGLIVSPATQTALTSSPATTSTSTTNIGSSRFVRTTPSQRSSSGLVFDTPGGPLFPPFPIPRLQTVQAQQPPQIERETIFIGAIPTTRQQQQVQEQSQETTPPPPEPISVTSFTISGGSEGGGIGPSPIQPIQPIIESPTDPVIPEPIRDVVPPPKNPPPFRDDDPFFIDRKRKGRVSKQAYNVLIKEKGKFLKANTKPLPRNKALNLGADIVDNSSAATFSIRKTSKKTRLIDDLNVARLNKFRQKGINTFIERNRNRIDTFGERRGITAKGLLALRRRRQAERLFSSRKAPPTSALFATKRRSISSKLGNGSFIKAKRNGFL